MIHFGNHFIIGGHFVGGVHNLSFAEADLAAVQGFQGSLHLDEDECDKDGLLGCMRVRAEPGLDMLGQRTSHET